MKKIVIFGFFVFLISAGTALSFGGDGHSMVTGTVNQIWHDTIVIDDTTYVLSPKCKVEIQYMVDNAFYLKPGRTFDIGRGDSVVVVKLANTRTEVTIERWKR